MKRASKKLIVVLVALLALPASGDWLVTRDGARVETKGPWRVQGSAVVFTLPSGTLSSLRLGDIDLDASSLATTEARRPLLVPKVPPPVKRKAKWVLTDKDIPQAAPLTAPPAAPDTAAPDTAATEPPVAEEQEQAPQAQLEVSTWEMVENVDIGGLEIVGEIQNSGGDLAFGVRVVVTLLDQNGVQIGTSDGFVAEKSLAPRTRSRFRALFPGIYQLEADPKFELAAENIRIGLPGAETAAEDEASAGEPALGDS